MKKQSTEVSLRREEWDFTSVADDEVLTCFLWEYIREWNELPRLANPTFFDRPTMFLGRIDCTGLGYQVKNMLLGHDAREVLPTPWLSLAPKQRRTFAGSGYLPGVSQVPFPEKMPESTYWSDLGDFTAQVSFAIQWQRNDSQLLEDFANWLRLNRPMKPLESRGNDFRDHLKMLGAMRLLHNYPFATCVELSEGTLGKPLYAHRPAWEKARQTAAAVFRKYFFETNDDGELPESVPYPVSYPKFKEQDL